MAVYSSHVYPINILILRPHVWCFTHNNNNNNNNQLLLLLRFHILPECLDQVEICEFMKLHKSMKNLNIEVISASKRMKNMI